MKSAPNTTDVNFKNGKILIIEDNDDQWFIIQEAMRQRIHEICAQRVSTTKQALALVECWRDQAWEIPRLILPLRRTVGSLPA